jgi:hypothetical protein
MAAGLDPDLRLDVYRDGVPIFGVKSLHAGQFEHSFDGIHLTRENDMRSATRNGRDQSDPNSGIPRLRVAAAPMPRGNLPPHVTPSEVETGADDDEPISASAALERLYEFCKEHELPMDALESIRQVAEAHEDGGDDAGPEPQRMVDDEEPLDAEVIERVLKHARTRLSPSALEGLEDLLSATGTSDADPPAFLNGHEREVERLIEGKDPRSAADMAEVYDRLDGMAASEMMQRRGAFEAGTGERMAERRDSARWWPGKGEAPGTNLPRAAGKVHPPGSLVMAADSKSFRKMVGLKKRHMRSLLRAV